jgi:hypothetical protein
VSDKSPNPKYAEDTPALPDPAAEEGQPDVGENQDVAARKIYPSDPTGADPA